MTLAEIVERFGGRPNGKGWIARCPAHEDGTASLSIAAGDKGGVLVKCFAGCETADVMTAAGLTLADLQPERSTSKARIIKAYDYTDEGGRLLYQVCRLDPKGFRQRRPDGSGGWTWKLGDVRRVLYRLSELQGQRHVFVTEGEKDALALVALGLVATTNAGGAGKWTADYTKQLQAAGVETVTILPDHDEPGRQHARTAAASCSAVGLAVKLIDLPGLPVKGDVSDWLAAGHTREELVALVAAAPEWTPATAGHAGARSEGTRGTVADVDKVFRKWLGKEYDLDALHAVLAVAAAERLAGDPVWVLIISGPGNAKTETVQALDGAGALVTSTIASEGALLSGTARREKTKDATGGLLRRLGDGGLLVIKDVTSILSMNCNTRAGVLAAIREIHDGRWERNVGTDGGRSLSWRGRIVVIGAVTTAWDRAHEVISAMGDRFVLVRMDSTKGRLAAGRQAIKNTGAETAMRAELARAMGSVLNHIDTSRPIALTDDEEDRILAAANVVTLARTGVEYDYRGNVIDAHAPEAPTRFAKQLSQILRAAVAIGIDRAPALRLAIRCARDSMPPLRLALLDDVSDFPGTATRDVRKRLGKPWATIDRQLQALHILGLLTCDEQESRGKTVWRYRLAEDIDPNALDPSTCPEKLVDSDAPAGAPSECESASTNFSGRTGDSDKPGKGSPNENGVRFEGDHVRFH